jgi:hypothetical protein
VNIHNPIPKSDIAKSIFSNHVIRNVPYFHARKVSMLCNITSTPTRYTDSPTPEKIDAKNTIAIDRVMISHQDRFGIVSPRNIEYIYRPSTIIAIDPANTANKR